MKRIITRSGLLVCAAVACWAQNPPPVTPPGNPAQNAVVPQAAPSVDPNAPQRIEERAYVRKFSAGVSLNFVPFNLFPKTTLTENIDSNPPIARRSAVDPQSNRFGLGVNLQYALSERWAIAANPTYRKVAFHAFIEEWEGVDNSSTPADERLYTRINEDTTSNYFDIPLLARYYKKDRHERGPRWFFEGGGTMRLATNIRTDREIVPPKGDTFRNTIPVAGKSTIFGATVGIGGQFIDDFGIRIAPEVRYTYWFDKTFDSIHGKSRGTQLEVLISFGF